MSPDKGIRSLPIPEGMKLPSGPAGTEPVHHHRSDPHDPIEVRVVSTDEGVGELLVRRTTGEELASRCRTTAETMPLKLKEQRSMFLKASFYKQCGIEVSFDLNEGTMSGTDEALRNGLRWYRDRAKYNLTPEQEKFLSEET